jgi:hypothetical protein
MHLTPWLSTGMKPLMLQFLKDAFSLLFFARDHFGPAGRMDTISVSHYLLIGIPNHITTRNIRRIFFHEEKRARRRR